MMPETQDLPIGVPIEEFASSETEAAVTERVENQASRPWRRRLASGVRQSHYWGVMIPYQFFCLVVLLGAVSSLPIFQLIAFGYLLDLAGRIAKAGTIRVGFSKLNEAAVLVTAAIAVYVASLPALLYGTYYNAANWIQTDNPIAAEMRQRGFLWAGIAMIYILWVWGRGGRIRDYLWPAPIRFLREGWRPRFWQNAYRQLWDFLARLEIVRYFWLGLRGLMGTLIWIGIPAALLINATREGETGLAGLVGLLGAASMGVVLLYLPFLQTQFAAEGRFRALFEVGRVRQSFRRAPFLFWIALALTLLLAIPPYLLKIEAVPREFVWMIATAVVAFVIPGRVFAGWAMARASIKPDPQGWPRRIWRWTIRFACVPVIVFYLMTVYATQLTSWHGLATWVQQHAISIPAPFEGT